MADENGPQLQLRSKIKFSRQAVNRQSIVQSATKTESSSSESSAENQLTSGNASRQQSTTLAVIAEEQASPKQSQRNLLPPSKMPKMKVGDLECICRTYDEYFKLEKERLHPEDIERMFNEKEEGLRKEYEQLLDKQVEAMNERFNIILMNEQMRASFMLREAHRDRQEKIRALQSQLECKNLSALMYVICTDRNQSKLEKMRIIEEYSNYIRELQDILTEGQNLILHLSRGYKTAARVDHEWREKMKMIIGEFMAYIQHFSGGPPETLQFYFDLENLMKIKSPIMDDLSEDPCQEEEVSEEQEAQEPVPEKKEWYELMAEEGRPFVMFGDIGDFAPPQRRKVLANIKATKTAPKKWKEYVFKDMCLKQNCPNHDLIKDSYLKKMPSPSKWSCQEVQTDKNDLSSGWGGSRMSLNNNRNRAWSVDVRGQMGSLLKIISTMNPPPQISPKTNLLGARDSIEISSATKLRDRASHCSKEDIKEKDVVLSIGRRRTSLFQKEENYDNSSKPYIESTLESKMNNEDHLEDFQNRDEHNSLGSNHNDSLHILQPRSPEKDHKINYERVCPVEKCQRMQVDSFIRNLPPYMRANPFTHFEQTFEEYEVCSPEQLEMLQQRIDNKKSKEELELSDATPVLGEWTADGVGVQTSEMDLDMPPCTCAVPSPTPVSSNYLFNFQDLYPVKQTLDEIEKECLFDDNIDFNRFRVIGQDISQPIKEERQEEFTQNRYRNIQRILKQHPSLLEIFQANTS